MALNNVPLSGQSLGVTRVPINQNFSVIDADFSVDHVAYNTTMKVCIIGFHSPHKIQYICTSWYCSVIFSSICYSANRIGVYHQAGSTEP